MPVCRHGTAPAQANHNKNKLCCRLVITVVLNVTHMQSNRHPSLLNHTKHIGIIVTATISHHNKTYYDPANYNVGFTNNKEQYIAWDDRNKGKLWWDLSTVKYIDYHQGSITYSQNTFNKLAEGASIDIYEWVESNILPSAWDSLADTNRGTALGISGTSKYGDTKYATQEIYDSVGQVFTTKYYFWVKDLTNHGQHLSWRGFRNRVSK